MPRWVHAVAADKPGTVLLETSRFDSVNRHSYLFLNPISTITATVQDDLPLVFSRIDAALSRGCYVAGFFSYECGYHFERFAWKATTPDGLPLAWLGVYDRAAIFDHSAGRFREAAFRLSSELPETSVEEIANNLTLGISQGEYCRRIQKIKDYIAAGDTYQVNFTDAVSFPMQSPVSATFETLLKNQPVSYGALLNVAGHQVLSFSPELFFRIDRRKIVTRPIKGTMPRGLDSVEDKHAVFRLQNDEKNRSEHVMIVDLLRNDLGRICTAGSIRVEDLFSVERYETLLQMTSTISGTLLPEIRYYDIFRSLFPCGSITGAPKIRTMQIIRELERNPRGIYTGAIGFMSPAGSCAFNVAIRTLVVHNGHAQMGVGGGIVADSDPEGEYRECLLKAAFLMRTRPDFQLIETMLWENGYRLESGHLDRLESSAAYFNF